MLDRGYSWLSGSILSSGGASLCILSAWFFSLFFFVLYFHNVLCRTLARIWIPESEGFKCHLSWSKWLFFPFLWSFFFKHFFYLKIYTTYFGHAFVSPNSSQILSNSLSTQLCVLSFSLTKNKKEKNQKQIKSKNKQMKDQKRENTKKANKKAQNDHWVCFVLTNFFWSWGLPWCVGWYV